MTKKTLLLLLVSTLLLVLAGFFVAKFWLIPSLAVAEFQKRTEAIDQSLGWKTTIEAIDPKFSGEISLHGIKISDQHGRPFFEMKSGETTLDLWKLLSSQKKVFSDIKAKDITLTLFRNKEGSFQLEEDLKNRKRKTNKDSNSERASLLERYFGGSFPSAEVNHINVIVDSQPGAPPFPFNKITIPELAVKGGNNADFTTQLNIDSTETPQWEIPNTVTVKGAIDQSLKLDTLLLKMDRPIRIGGIGRLKGVEIGLNGIGIEHSKENEFFDASKAHQLQVKGFTLGLANSEKPFVSVDQLLIDAEHLTTGLSQMILHNVTLNNAKISIDRKEGSSPEIQQVKALLGLNEPSVSDQNQDQGGTRVDPNNTKTEEENDNDPIGLADDANPNQDPTTTPPENNSSSKKFSQLFASIQSKLDRLPSHVDADHIEITVNDETSLSPEASRTLSLTSENFALSYDKKEASFEMSGNIIARGDGKQRGKGDGRITVNPKNKTFEADLKLEQFDVGWLGQLAGPTLSDYIQSGIVSANISLKPLTKQGSGAFSAVSFDGSIDVKNLTVEEHHLADRPVVITAASYTFSGHYDPDEPVAPATLLKVPLFYGVDANGSNSPSNKDNNEENSDANGTHLIDPRLKKGAFLVDKGDFLFNGARGSFTFGLYGMRALPEMLPSRIDIGVTIPPTPVMQLFDAVPSAILGPLQGTEMSGSFGWNYKLELPLYRAADMVWKSDTELTNFKLLSMPSEVDIRKMEGPFTHTITDTIYPDTPRETIFTKTIDIGEMTPVSAPWLIENTNLTIEEIDEGRRRRGWPKIPPEYEIDRSPSVWLRRGLIHNWDRASDQPWYNLDQPWLDSLASYNRPVVAMLEGDAENGIPAHPDRDSEAKAIRSQQRNHPIPEGLRYRPTSDSPEGAYFYTPLPLISKYVTRAILTTEDGTFFTNDGFNTRALKNSIRDNLEAGRFRRGASTISMQLIKNLFLSRDKVLARKLREAFLVWLMESIVDVPKERMLELYFNVIEFGPKVFGINAASIHYFGKRPNELSLAEVAWLVSIIPSPKKYHRYYEQGAISSVHLRRMRRYINAMYNRERITEEERDKALAEVPKFYKPSSGESILDPYYYWNKLYKNKLPERRTPSLFELSHFGEKSEENRPATQPVKIPLSN